MTRHPIAIALVAVAALACGCDKATHENLDKWMDTEKGPGKLRDTLRDSSADADLSAHAAENLFIIHDEGSVRDAIEKMTPERRAAVLAKLAPRLWKLARIEGELTVASAQQMAAKDLLFSVRGTGDAATNTVIDGYLIEWFSSGYYEDRATRGRYTGDIVMRAIGKSAGPSMISAANAVLGTPAGKDGKRVRVGDQLLLGLGVTGDPEAVEHVLAIGAMDRGDPTLPERAVAALYRGYVEPPSDLFPRADPAGLVPNLPALQRIARDEDNSNRVLNDAFDLIEAAGPPACLETLVSLVNAPHTDVRYLWVAVSHALRCGQVSAIDVVIKALPEAGNYEHVAMEDAVVAEIAKMEPRDGVLAAARTLVTATSWVARWVGIEVLAKVASKEDADRIAGLAKDKATLTGYWGDEKGHGRMTLGQRATALAKGLE